MPDAEKNTVWAIKYLWRQRAEAKEILRKLVEDKNAAIVSQYAGNDYYQCVYCQGYADERADVKHAPDCPIIEARKLLGL